MLSIISVRIVRPQFAYEPDPASAQACMEGLVYSLNSGPYRRQMRHLVELWATSGSNGPNLRALFKRMPELEEKTAFSRTVLWPTETGRGYLEWEAGMFPPELSLSWEDHALSEFMLLITNPLWWKLSGPCERCDEYYLKKRAGQKRFCSQKCGSAATATVATRKSRAQRQRNKLQLAQKAINDVVAQKPNIEAKKLKQRVANEVTRWLIVAKKVRGTSRSEIREDPCTVKWLTRALNRGDLLIPGP
jgi:hypothetical protein